MMLRVAAGEGFGPVAEEIRKPAVIALVR